MNTNITHKTKNMFVSYIKNARANGVYIGTKIIAATIISFINDFYKKENPSIDDYAETINKIKDICEKTTSITMEEIQDKTGLIKEIFETADKSSKEQ